MIKFWLYFSCFLKKKDYNTVFMTILTNKFKFIKLFKD